MAKPPLVVPFTFAESLISVGDFQWILLRSPAFDGGAGNFTISRVVFYYQMSYNLEFTSNGDVDKVVLLAIAVTTGSPAFIPSVQPVNEQSSGVDEIIYREIPRMVVGTSQGATFCPAQGRVDAKSQTRIPASPGEAAVWLGVQRYDESGPLSGNTVEVRGWGYVVRLG